MALIRVIPKNGVLRLSRDPRHYIFFPPSCNRSVVFVSCENPWAINMTSSQLASIYSLFHFHPSRVYNKPTKLPAPCWPVSSIG